MASFDTKSNYLSRLVLVMDLSLVGLAFAWSIRMYPVLRASETLDVAMHFGLMPIALLVYGLSRRTLSRNFDVRRRTLAAQSIAILKEVGITVAALATLIFLLKLNDASRVFLVTFAISAALLLLFAHRLIVWWYFSRSGRSHELDLRVLVIGSGRRARLLADQMHGSSDFGVDIVGFLDPKGVSAGRRAEDEILGHSDDIRQVLRDNVVEDVIVAVPRSMIGDLQTIIDACQEEGVRLRFMADIYDFDAARIRLSLVNDIPLLSFEPVARGENALVAKRIFDLVVTLAAMPLILPVMGITALLIRLDSPGPIMFTQDRVGFHKRLFKMYKFRSMVPDAEARMKEIEHLNEADGPNFKIENDPRVTRVGRFIRKTSIDELPQLFNVLIGDMSLVGPRPMSTRDVELFDQGKQRRRFSVRPGITCLWQISGRSDLSFDDWLKLDLQYIDNWSFWKDIKILFMTIPAVLFSKGAV